jgi:hypothetical protein
MRLSDILSKPISSDFQQVENFLGIKRLGPGKQRKISIGKVVRTYLCNTCNLDITFTSTSEELYCIGVNESLISIDCVLVCPKCKNEIPVWFLIESKNFEVQNPEVRILKYTEKFSYKVSISKQKYGIYSNLLEKAERAYRNELGAGAIIYLREVYEKITVQIARAENIDIQRIRHFRQRLEQIDKRRHIIPSEFSANGYKLFSELSEIIHSGNTDNEEDGIKKYSALRRLVIGVLDNVNNNNELMSAIGELGWNNMEDKK